MFDEHIREIIATKEHFAKYQKARGTDGSLCVSFDLQKVLNSPHGHNMLLYYSRKYFVYNFTVYVRKQYKGGVYYYVVKVDAKKTLQIDHCIVLYCGSCLHFETIVNNYYLLPGHSYMPVDSVHSAIETQGSVATFRMAHMD
ncbi:hypothetical protein PR048_024169 [Dryococelus australis]|uniref:Uncharacterized protein n=1 Tax=Dryococelus australis TaxID=614101 RepID=A0ABQ9GW53_9NEOP|nr:hypothetical protein PR048_024169 [Dryococelus australis]